MPEELGFRTPAKELQELRRRVEQVEGLSTGVVDAVVLSLWALAWLHLIQAKGKPENARKLKDILLDSLKELDVDRGLLDALDAMCKGTCEDFEGEIT
jgi:hypothetical protein